MADAWGGSWGSSWGLNWGGVAPVVEPLRRHGGISTDLARRLDAEREEFEQLRVDRERALRDAIERAFAEPAFVPPAEAEVRPAVQFDGVAIATSALALAKLQGIAASLDEMLALIEAYHAEMAIEQALAQELDDEEAIIAIFLAA